MCLSLKQILCGNIHSALTIKPPQRNKTTYTL